MTRPISRWGARRALEHWERFRMDAARWIVPEEIAPIEEVTPTTLARLLWRYPSLRAMFWFRFGCAARSLGIRGVGPWVQRHLLLRYGLELIPGNHVGGGLYIAHPVGCVLVAGTMGANVTVIASVVFGARSQESGPLIGEEAFFGAGSKVLGRVAVGRGAKVGAAALVLDDVPPRATVVGSPARVVRTAG